MNVEILKEPFPNKISESELFNRYKSSYYLAMLDLSIHVFYLYCSFYLVWFFRNSWLSILTVSLLGLVNVKTFTIFHDCCHQSYTPNKILNYVLAHITGIFILTSPNWITDHSVHHLTNGNIENKYKFKFNELVYITKKQYDNFNIFNKYVYSFIHHPIIFFNFVPFVYFVILQRFIYYKNNHKNTLIFFNHLINNILIYIYCKLLLNYDIFLLVFISTHIVSIIGFCLFFNQHTFNPPYVVNNDTWSIKNSGLQGSSFIQIPYILKYFSGGIEYHHIHHINAKIPGYNLHKYHADIISQSNLFDNIVKLSMFDCYNNLWLVLYDEDKKKYI